MSASSGVLKPASHRSVVVPVLGLIILVSGILQNFTRQLSERQYQADKSEIHYAALRVDPRVIKRLLGTRILAADLLWIDTLIKSDIKREQEYFTNFYKASKVIVTLDPENYFAYYVLGLYLSVIKDDVKGATVILREGSKSLEALLQSKNWDEGAFSKKFLDTAWRVFFAAGFNLIFEEHEIEEGSKWVANAGKIPGSPLYVRKLAEMVSTEMGRLEVASRVLSDMYRRVTDPKQKQIIEQKQLRIASEHEALEMNERFRLYLETTGSYALPKARAYEMFLRNIHHNGRDVRGLEFKLNDLGKIVIQ